MKRSRVFSVMMIICLILSFANIRVFAAEEDSKGLEQAIITAKNIITVPENYTEFTHSISEKKTINGKIKVWNLNWSEKDGKNGYVSVTIGDDGFIYNYNKYDNIDEKPNGLAKVNKDQAQTVAEEFVRKIVPSVPGEIKKVDIRTNNYSSEKYDFSYQQFINDVPVEFIIFNIGINKYTGEVNYFNGENPKVSGQEYPALEGIISEDQAEKAYLEKIGVNLKYYYYYDYKNKKINIFPGYSIDGNNNKYIDAKTGQVMYVNKDSRIFIDKEKYTESTDLKSGLMNVDEKLTDEEIGAVKDITSLITKEEAEKILKGASGVIDSDSKVTDVSLNKKYINDGYILRVSFENAFGEVDAKSGEVISLHSYNNKAVNTSISKDEAKNIAENFLKKIAPNKFSQTKYKENEFIILKDKVIQEGNISTFNFIRQVNGIEFVNNLLKVEVDKSSGKVVGYDNNWYEDIAFPDVSQAMSKQGAFNKIKEFTGFGMQYVMQDNKLKLVYNFKNVYDSYIIDPVSGIRLDFSGKPYKENKLLEYTDISGHWCEKTVKSLLDNGYYIDGDKFNPNMYITQINFLKYLYSPVKNNYDSDDEFYDMLIKNGVIKSEEKAPNSLVSNQDAAKFVIRYLGYDKIAMHSEIFSNPFKDNIEEKYKGYAAMSYGLNIIKGINGNFNGTHNINNAEAAAIIFNLVSIDKK